MYTRKFGPIRIPVKNPVDRLPGQQSFGQKVRSLNVGSKFRYMKSRWDGVELLPFIMFSLVALAIAIPVVGLYRSYVAEGVVIDKQFVEAHYKEYACEDANGFWRTCVDKISDRWYVVVEGETRGGWIDSYHHQVSPSYYKNTKVGDRYPRK